MLASCPEEIKSNWWLLFEHHEPYCEKCIHSILTFESLKSLNKLRKQSKFKKNLSKKFKNKKELAHSLLFKH